MTPLISTVEHSGTESLRKMLGLKHGHHCEPAVIDMLNTGEYDLFTTYRDPYRVAASWANRKIDADCLYNDEQLADWTNQWFVWHQIKPQAKKIYQMTELTEYINEHQDTHGLHAALGRGDLDFYHRYIPVDYIEVANGNHG